MLPCWFSWGTLANTDMKLDQKNIELIKAYLQDQSFVN